MSSAANPIAALHGDTDGLHENLIETRKVFPISLPNFHQANERGSSLIGKRSHYRGFEHVFVKRTEM